MKKVYLYIALAANSLFTSCSSFLEENPADRLMTTISIRLKKTRKQPWTLFTKNFMRFTCGKCISWRIYLQMA